MALQQSKYFSPEHWQSLKQGDIFNYLYQDITPDELVITEHVYQKLKYKELDWKAFYSNCNF